MLSHSGFLVRKTGFEISGIFGIFACCGALCAPCRRRGYVAHRPQPLAQVASPATGGAPIAPPKQETCFARRMPQYEYRRTNKFSHRLPQGQSIAEWSKWRDSFASALCADRGSPRSSPRRQRLSALHLIVRVSSPKEISRNGIKPFLLIWSKWRDSNSRHPAPKAGALPTALHLDDLDLVYYTRRRGKKQS